MKTIWKFPIEIIDHPSVQMPFGSMVLHAGAQNGNLFLWALVDPDEPMAERCFAIYGTGRNGPESTTGYVGTIFDGSFVWHIFET